jgi:hypothetical protein
VKLVLAQECHPCEGRGGDFSAKRASVSCANSSKTDKKSKKVAHFLKKSVKILENSKKPTKKIKFFRKLARRSLV